MNLSELCLTTEKLKTNHKVGEHSNTQRSKVNKIDSIRTL